MSKSYSAAVSREQAGPKDARINVRVREELKNLLQEQAGRKGQRLTDFLLLAAIDKLPAAKRRRARELLI